MIHTPSSCNNIQPCVGVTYPERLLLQHGSLLLFLRLLLKLVVAHGHDGEDEVDQVEGAKEDYHKEEDDVPGPRRTQHHLVQVLPVVLQKYKHGEHMFRDIYFPINGPKNTGEGYMNRSKNGKGKKEKGKGKRGNNGKKEKIFSLFIPNHNGIGKNFLRK